jgi:hypothetical protein
MIGLDNAREKTVRYRQDSVDEQVRPLLNCARSHNSTFSRTELLDGGLTMSAHSADLYEKFAAECGSLVASGKGDEIKFLPFREGKVIITSAKTFLSYRDVETSKAAVEQMIAHIKVPLLIVYMAPTTFREKALSLDGKLSPPGSKKVR